MSSPPVRAVSRRSLAVVLVVTADPDLPLVSFVAALGRVVEDGVVAHQELDTAACRRVGVVNGVVDACEGAEPKKLGEVAKEVGAARVCVVLSDRWQLALYRLYGLAGLLHRGREAEIEVEVAVRGGDPGDAPAHAALVGLQL